MSYQAIRYGAYVYPDYMAQEDPKPLNYLNYCSSSWLRILKAVGMRTKPSYQISSKVTAKFYFDKPELPSCFIQLAYY